MTIRLFVTSLFSLTLACVLSACGDSPASPTGVDSNPNASGIVKGHKVKAGATIGQSVVALVAEHDDSQALCTGTLLADDLVLTAAHCVEGHPTKIAIIFKNSVKGVKAEDMRTADGYVQNPRWEKPTEKGRGDLALIHFDGGLVEGYSAVKLAEKDLDLKSGTEVELAGYGVSNTKTKSGAGVLRETTSSVVSQATPTEFVTDGEKSSVCFGDSGGPAFVKDGDTYVQWGVASSVTTDACNQESIHTAVMSYLSWMKSAGAKLRKKS